MAKGLTLRHDHGSNYMADDFQNEIKCFGILGSHALVRRSEDNDVAERAIRTLKEQLLWVQYFQTIAELWQALASFAAQDNPSWLRQRHGYKTPNQIGAEQKAFEPEAATGLNRRRQQRRALSQNRAPVQTRTCRDQMESAREVRNLKRRAQQ